jgi:hypothetical protein
LADSQNGLDTGLNIEAQFATNPVENPQSAALEYTLDNGLRSAFLMGMENG